MGPATTILRRARSIRQITIGCNGAAVVAVLAMVESFAAAR